VPTEQTFKDGGIVGFAEGGKTPKTNEPSEWRLLVPAAAAGSAAALAGLEPIATGLGYDSAGALVRAVVTQGASEVKGGKMPGAPTGLMGKLGVLGALGSTAYDTATTPKMMTSCIMNHTTSKRLHNKQKIPIRGFLYRF
jgi:hypothetical protein